MGGKEWARSDYADKECSHLIRIDKGQSGHC